MHRSVPLFLLCALTAHADEASIRKNLAERYPGAPAIVSVQPSPLPGIFEVYTDNRLLYTDANADYLLLGTLIDTRARINLTQRRLLELSKVKFDALPFEHAITLVKGGGERRIAVFSDPECPHCRALEQALANLDNLTVHVFLLPLADLHPRAVSLAEAVWCADDRALAWRALMLEGTPPQGGKSCPTPLAAIARLAGELRIQGTPALILSDGRMLAGALSSAELEALLAAR